MFLFSVAVDQCIDVVNHMYGVFVIAFMVLFFTDLHSNHTSFCTAINMLI